MAKTSYLFPTNHSGMIRSKHYQIVRLQYDGCCICEEMPNITIDTVVIPNKCMPEFKGFVPPPGPPCFEMGRFDLVIADYVVDSD